MNSKLNIDKNSVLQQADHTSADIIVIMIKINNLMDLLFVQVVLPYRPRWPTHLHMHYF